MIMIYDVSLRGTGAVITASITENGEGKWEKVTDSHCIDAALKEVLDHIEMNKRVVIFDVQTFPEPEPCPAGQQRVRVIARQ